jgi:oxalate decarboxylase
MQPPFGPAPPPLDGPELPSFRFPLGSLPTKTFNGGTAKQATVVEFLVSEKLAGVYMTLEPGALRELHWHANAAEWAYVIEGRCRVTTIDPQNQCEIVDFGPGDVWYFPRGHGHSIQGIGPGTCVFVLVFDNGYFSEFGTFSISDWLGHTPPEVLAKTFELPQATFADFPKKEVYIATGPVPPPIAQEPARLAECAAAHPPLPAARPEPRRLRRRHHAHGVASRVSHLGDHDRRAPHHQARRLARAALAPERRGMAALSQR